MDQACRNGCASIAYTYTEPTIYVELALETAILAREKGLLNLFVTNGYMTPEVIHKMAPYLDGANVDLKAFNENFYKKLCGARLEPVKQNLILMKSLGILVEVTTLLIPGHNDNRDEIKAMAAFIAEKMGTETPWHISRFYPCHGMTHVPPTPYATLEMAFQAGKDAGLRYVYIGNAPDLGQEDTCCHVCGETIIKRTAYRTANRMTTPGECPPLQQQAPWYLLNPAQPQGPPQFPVVPWARTFFFTCLRRPTRRPSPSGPKYDRPLCPETP